MDDFQEQDVDPIQQIEELTAKKEQAQLLLTRYTTQLESLTQERDELVNSLQKEYGTTLDQAHNTLESLKQERDQLLSEAKAALSQIKL